MFNTNVASKLKTEHRVLGTHRKAMWAPLSRIHNKYCQAELALAGMIEEGK